MGSCSGVQDQGVRAEVPEDTEGGQDSPWGRSAVRCGTM